MQLAYAQGLFWQVKIKEPPTFRGGMDGDTVCSFVYMVDIYFALTSIINERTRHKPRNYTSNVAWGMLKSDLLSQFKSVDYDRLNCEAFDWCRQRSSNVSEYIRAFKLALHRCDTHVSEE